MNFTSVKIGDRHHAMMNSDFSLSADDVAILMRVNDNDKSFARRVATVELEFSGQSISASPVKMMVQLRLGISEARNLAEALLRSARKLEESIDSFGADD